MKKTFLILGLVLAAAVMLASCSKVKSEISGKEQKAAENSASQSNAGAGSDNASNQDKTVYHNTEYGFDFTLPASWKGYTIVTDEWKANPIGSADIAASGPLISIRSPKWTKEKPLQDITIMVVTLQQWDQIKQEKYHIGAAPVPPSELARNSKYVFALPARYNFAFLTGYEDVESILKTNPIVGTETKK